MVFSSGIFLYGFLPLFLALYALSPRAARNATIAVASYVFYGWWRPDFVLLMAFSTVVDFALGRRIAAAQARGGRGRRFVTASVIVNLGLLGYFKYANFGVDTFNRFLEAFGAGPAAWTEVVLPIGISFYTFQTMSYTIDVYRRTAPPVSRFVDFAAYVAMFPQLVAGPIVRYGVVADQLVRREHGLARFGQGVALFQCGFVKKVLVADVLAGPASSAFDAAAAPATLDAWVGLLAYTFQIYFDFSGYSDMAIGLGLMMGFRFPVNFIRPYAAVSITDFWRRWHVTLSNWLRDYLYVPLGGNRRGRRRTLVNLMLTMLLGGLWHGAAFTFVVWGAYQGAWLVVERLARGRATPLRVPAALRVALTFLIVAVGWVPFRSPDLAFALDYLAALVGLADAHAATIAFAPVHVGMLALAGVLVWAFPTSQDLSARLSPVWTVPLQALFAAALLQLHHDDFTPFLYFRF